jgi:hypothetical protein
MDDGEDNPQLASALSTINHYMTSNAAGKRQSKFYFSYSLYRQSRRSEEHLGDKPVPPGFVVQSMV